MSDAIAEGRVLPVTSLQEYFKEAVHGALDHRHVRVADHTEHYVVNLLTLFARADALHDGDDGAPTSRPLAMRLADALDARRAARCHALQRLGDISLFVAGIFAGGFARKLVDVDYYIGMGGRAYATLAGSVVGGPRRALSQVFAELADKFQPLVDALNEIAAQQHPQSDRDLMRLYEIWARTGSTRARMRLTQLGVTPTCAAIGLRTQ